MRALGWASVAIALALAGCGPRPAAPMTAFEGRLQDWTHEILADSPETATQASASADDAGEGFGARLDDRSDIAVEARRSAALRRYAELRALDANAIPESERLTYDALSAQFQDAAGGAQFSYGDFTPLGGIKPYVLNQLDSAFLTLPTFLDERQQVRSPADAEAYLARLHAVSGALDQETARARQDADRGIVPPTFIIDDTLTLLDGVLAKPLMEQDYITAFKRKLDAFAATITDPARRAAADQRNLQYLGRALAIVRDEILPAHQRAAIFLRAVRQNSTDQPGVSRLPHGAEFYRAALRIQTTTDLTPEQIHNIGGNRVRDLTQQLDIALRRVGLTEGPVGARLAQLTADPRYRYEDSDAGRAQLIADVRARLSAMLQRAPQWFGTLPRARFDVRPVPASLEASQSGAYYNAPPLDGSGPGIYYINLRDLAEITRIDLPTQDFHEAIPGHHFQIALAQQQTDQPLLRRLISFNAYAEGWGLYAEQFADEQGFYENDPVGRIGYLRWQLWRAARLVVDTGLHAFGWSRAQAITYLTQTTGDTPGVIQTEVDRYVTWPGQACSYELGRREIVRMREYARNELGPDFDLRGFHDAVLLHGEVPLTVLDHIVRDWIPEQRRNAEHERRRR